MKQNVLPAAIMILVVSCSLPTRVACVPQYQQRLPNGEKYPGSGHGRFLGGESLSTFGEDFKSAGYTWTTDLCQKDSDCDGYTNGQELGDPQCVWHQGDVPQFDAGITNPSIGNFERNALDTCAENTNALDDDLNLSHEENTVRFLMPGFEVPSQRTTYAKYAMRLDNVDVLDDSYAIRFEAVIDQPELVHRITLYNCDSEPMGFINEPTNMTDAMTPCASLVYAWAIGGKALCLPPKVGIAFEASSPWYLIDVHYNNPQGIVGAVDKSGIQVTTITQTKVSGLGFQRAAYASVGLNHNIELLQIPPKRDAFELTVECAIAFNNIPTSGVSVFAYFLHAHLITKKIWTEVRKGSIDSYDLGCNTNYDFDLQETVPLLEHQKLLPGDILTTHCVYDSSERTTVIQGGDATKDEMCTAFFLYYPAVDGDAICFSDNIEFDAGDGQHVCAIPGQVSTNDDRCTSSSNVDETTFRNMGFNMQVHVISMFLSWCILFPLGAIIPLVYKPSAGTKGTLFHLHRGIQVLGVVLMIIGFLSVAVKVGKRHFRGTHQKLSLAVMIFVILQSLSGFLRPKKAPNTELPFTKSRVIWERMHKGCGYSTVILGWVAVFLGSKLLHDMYALSKQDTKILIVVQVISMSLFLLALLWGLYSNTKRGHNALGEDAERQDIEMLFPVPELPVEDEVLQEEEILFSDGVEEIKDAECQKNLKNSTDLVLATFNHHDDTNSERKRVFSSLVVDDRLDEPKRDSTLTSILRKYAKEKTLSTFSNRKYCLFIITHITSTIVIFGHFGFTRYSSRIADLPMDEVHRNMKVIAPTIAYGMKHVINFHLVILPLTMCRWSIAFLSTTKLARYIPFEDFTAYHIAVGYAAVLFVGLAFVVFLIYYGTLCAKGDGEFCQKFTSEIMISGYVAFVCFMIVGISSFYRFQIKYRWFYNIHRSVFLGFFVSIMHTIDHLHRSQGGRSQAYKWFTASLLLYITDNVNQLTNARHKCPVLGYHVIKSKGGNNQVVILKLRKPEQFFFKPGQYAKLKISKIDKTWHPFTIASSPDSNIIEFYIKVNGQGSWTRELMLILEDRYKEGSRQEYHPALQLEMTGPFGTPLVTELKDHTDAIVIGSGTGVVSCLSLLHQHIRKCASLNPDIYLAQKEQNHKRVTSLSRDLGTKNLHGITSGIFGRLSMFLGIIMGLLSILCVISVNGLTCEQVDHSWQILVAAIMIAFHILFLFMTASRMRYGVSMTSLFDCIYIILNAIGLWYWVRIKGICGLGWSDISLFLLLNGYAFLRFWVEICADFNCNPIREINSNRSNLIVLDKVTFVWLERSAEVVDALLPILEKVWTQLADVWGEELANEVLEIKIFCTDKDENEFMRLRDSMATGRLESKCLKHQRPDFLSIFRNQFSQLRSTKDFSSTAIGFCGSRPIGHIVKKAKLQHDVWLTRKSFTSHHYDLKVDTYSSNRGKIENRLDRTGNEKVKLVLQRKVLENQKSTKEEKTGIEESSQINEKKSIEVSTNEEPTNTVHFSPNTLSIKVNERRKRITERRARLEAASFQWNSMHALELEKEMDDTMIGRRLSLSSTSSPLCQGATSSLDHTNHLFERSDVDMTDVCSVRRAMHTSPSKEDTIDKTAEEYTKAAKPPQDNTVQECVQSPAVQDPSVNTPNNNLN